MRIHVAGNGDTLRTIAKQYLVDVELIHIANPHIPSIHANLSGSTITIPSMSSPIIAGTAFSCPPAAPSTFLDNWIPLTPLPIMAETEYDVLIVGTGMGGGALLWRLCEQWANTGKRIGVVEAGDLLLSSHHWNIPTLNRERSAQFFANPNNFYPIGKTLPEFSGAKELIALGGKTLAWGTVSPRILNSELQYWPISQQEMEKYYNIAESIMNVSSAYSRDSSFTQILLNRLWENGFSKATYSPMAVDTNPTKYGEIHSNTVFSSINFIAKALNVTPFDLAVKATATRILTDQGKTVGIVVSNEDKQTFVLRSKTVVVATSTLETPRLLLHSAIPGRAIGHYLTNQSLLVTNGVVSTPNIPEVLGTLAILIPSTVEQPYQVQVQGPNSYYWYHDEVKMLQNEWGLNFFGGFGKVESRYENRVFLDHSRLDANGVPKIGVHFTYSEYDRAVIHRIESAMRQIALAAGIQLIGTNDQPDFCLLPPGADYHEFGTCRMGDDPSTSVTNSVGQIHGISGLFIAGNSILPSIGAANPSLTTAAMAIRTADYISTLN